MILRPCNNWNIAPFGQLQALPEGAKAISTWRPQDLGYRNVADRVQELAFAMRNRQGYSVRDGDFAKVTRRTPLVDPSPKPV